MGDQWFESKQGSQFFSYIKITTKKRTKRRLQRKGFDRFCLRKTIKKRRILTSEKQNSSTRVVRAGRIAILYESAIFWQKKMVVFQFFAEKLIKRHSVRKLII